MTQQEKMKLKGQGCIPQNDGVHFALRYPLVAGCVTSAQIRAVADVAETYGRGYYVETVRLGLEIPYIKPEDIPAAREKLAAVGLYTGGTGKRVRPIVPCKGTVCVHGLFDTLGLCRTLHERFYAKDTVAKFKIGLAGCPNNCTKAQLNDIGIIGCARPQFDADKCTGCGVCVDICPVKCLKLEDGKIAFDASKCVDCGKCIKACPTDAFSDAYRGVYIFVGGRFGRSIRIGDRVDHVFTPDEVPDAVEKIIAWYQENALDGERTSATVERLGIDAINALFR